MSNKPTLYAYAVKDRGRNQKAIWTRIGAAWPHEKGKGFTIELEAFPIDGRLVLTEPIGVVTQAGIGDGEPVLIGEVERPLGLGPELIAISAGMFVDRGDHIQLTLTADQIREKLAKTKQ